jgi:hypothetical protein
MAQQPPSYPPPPAQGPPAPGYPAPGYQAGRPARPGSVTAAGVLLIILGSFAALGGIFVMIGAAFLATADFGELAPGFDVFGAAAGIAVVLGIVVLVYATFKIISGAKVLALRNGWRIAGIVLCAVAIVGWILSLISAFQGGESGQFDPNTLEFTTVSTGPNIGGIVLSAILLATNIITLVLLARSGEAFRRG